MCGGQASYMGFPATTGASFLPYLITDRVVAPDDLRDCYSEHLARMPHSYFVNDYKGAHMVHTLIPLPLSFCCTPALSIITRARTW